MAHKRLCIITSGHLSTCPRMLKAADAAAGAGWQVHVVASSFDPAKREIDETLAGNRPWALTRVDWQRDRRPFLWWRTRARRSIGRVSAIALGARAPMGILGRATSRAYCELVTAAASVDADLYYGGGGGGTLVAAAAALATGRPYALDFEDLHSGESAPGSIDQSLWTNLERRMTSGAAFVTAGSTAIAHAYAASCGREVTPIHNTFPLPERAPTIAPEPARVRFYWVGQTIGPGRALGRVVNAIVASELPAHLTLRGNPDQAFVANLRDRARRTGSLSITVLPFAAAQAMSADCAAQDVGLAFEPGVPENNRLALGNKPLTYVVGGIAPLLSDIRGHAELVKDLGAHALAAPPEDQAALVAVLRSLSSPDRVCGARRAAWAAAVRRWHWEHPDDRGRLLNLIGAALA